MKTILIGVFLVLWLCSPALAEEETTEELYARACHALAKKKMSRWGNFELPAEAQVLIVHACDDFFPATFEGVLSEVSLTPHDSKLTYAVAEAAYWQSLAAVFSIENMDLRARLKERSER